MKEQNFKNHPKFVPLYHGLTAILILSGLIAALVKFTFYYLVVFGRLVAALLVLLFIIGGLLFWFTRIFSLRAQDRAIRAEENLRYFSLTGKLFDGSLKIGQIIALRFAPNDELIALTDRAVIENLSSNDIKRYIKNWKGDYYRV